MRPWAGVIFLAMTCSAAALNPVYGRYCAAAAPPGWFVSGESAQRVAFGADLQSGDGLAGASYSVFSAGALNIVPGNETPERAVANAILLSGFQPATVRKQTGPGGFQVEFQNATARGYAFYHVFPAGPGSYMIVMRSATTAIGVWRQRSAEAGAVARSLHCNVPYVPPDYDYYHHHRHHHY